MELQNRIFEVVFYSSFLFSAACHPGGNNFFDNIDRDSMRQKRSGFCQSAVYKKMNDELMSLHFGMAFGNFIPQDLCAEITPWHFICINAPRCK